MTWNGRPASHVLLPFPEAPGRPMKAPTEVPGRVGPARGRRRALAVLATLSVAVPGFPSPASGGPSPEVCRPYATAFTEMLIKQIWQGAYEFCRVEGIGDATPLMPDGLGQADAILRGDLPGTVGPSGFAPDTAGWKAWCRANWPRSFDGETVIFEFNGKGKRGRCPG